VNSLIRWLPLVLLAALWEVVPRLGIVDPQYFPPLSATIGAFIALTASGDLPAALGASMLVLVAGLGLAIIIGVPLGVLMAWRKRLDLMVHPLVRITYPLPKSALIPVLIIWFGFGAGAKISSVFLGCLLPVVISAYNGAKGVDHILMWSARAAGANHREVLRDVVLPAALPEILAGIRNALGLSFVLLVAAELIIGQTGFGFLIGFLGDGGLYRGMFATVLTVAAIGFIADRLFLLWMAHHLRWRA
jgi:NitT/TauT family transport system permease protein